jgi:hypothetical protein
MSEFLTEKTFQKTPARIDYGARSMPWNGGFSAHLGLSSGDRFMFFTA